VADTAGLRDQADVVEAEGIRRARQEMTRADRILYVVDGQHGTDLGDVARELAGLPSEVPVTLVVNKIDLIALASRYEQSQP
ncbi:GTPase, partial [Enterococcus casseliflavus]|uniref:GTPase n=1 Tax=Enterococcus casseliflavus TaxID=37734 RepID=UPI003D10C28F